MNFRPPPYITPRFNWGHAVLVVLLLTIIYYGWKLNVVEYMQARPFSQFKYPLDIDMEKATDLVISGEKPKIDPINSYYYPFIFNLDKKCKTPDGEDEDIFLLLLIKSKVDNFQERMMIRKTWGREMQLPYTKIKRVFLLGIDFNNRQVQHRVGLEMQEFDDILQQYFHDTYFNNTLKLMMGFHWLITYCRTARYVAFLDDDYYVNMNLLVDYLPAAIKPNDVHSLIIGYIWDKSMPRRIRGDKWYVSLEEYPYQYYPPYPTAGSFIVPFETAQRLQAAMQFTKFFRFDDVFIGILVHKLRIKLKHNPNMYFYEHRYESPDQYSNVIASHGYKDVELLYKVWKEMQNYYDTEIQKDKEKFAMPKFKG